VRLSSSHIASRRLARWIVVERFRNCRTEVRGFLGASPYMCICINPVSGLNPILEVLFQNKDRMSWLKYLMYLCSGWKITFREYSQQTMVAEK
jgi:hypothetical protein